MLVGVSASVTQLTVKRLRGLSSSMHRQDDRSACANGDACLRTVRVLQAKASAHEQHWARLSRRPASV